MTHATNSQPVDPEVNKLYTDYWNNKLDGQSFQKALTALLNKSRIETKIEELQKLLLTTECDRFGCTVQHRVDLNIIKDRIKALQEEAN